MTKKDMHDDFDFEKEFNLGSKEENRADQDSVNVSVISDKPKEVEEEKKPTTISTKLFVVRTTSNREEHVIDFLESNIKKKKLGVYSIFHTHGMRAYIFAEAESKEEVERAVYNVPYARGVLPTELEYKEIEHMLEQTKTEVNIKISDIVEIISGPFKRETAKVSRIDKTKDEVVVELLEAAVSIPITVKMDAVKVIRRED